MQQQEQEWVQAYFKRQPIDYEITRDGRIRSLKPGKFRYKRLLKKWLHGKGYWTYRVRLIDENGKGRTRGIYLHCLLMYTFKSLPPELNYTRSITVNHRDGDKLNNDLSNLEWTTFQQNVVHAFDMALKKKTRGLVNYNTYLFRNDDGTEFTGTSRELYYRYRDQYKLFQQGLNSMVRGRNMSNGKNVTQHKGWRIVKLIQQNIDGLQTQTPIYKPL